MKFSIIIPVYNVEKYIARCLDSIINQTFSDYEVLVINDGSPDNSQAVIDEYVTKYPDKIKSFIKENGGLSDARNFGIERAEGEYLLFIDSDDYIAEDLLTVIDNELKCKNLDIFKFSVQTVYEDGALGEIAPTPVLKEVSGELAIEALIDNKHYFEPAWLYAYRREFWLQNNFCFAKGKYHEDFGLIPEIIIKANSFSSVDFIGYFYVQTPTSIIRNCDYSKTVAKTEDIFFHVQRLKGIAQTNISSEKLKAKVLSYLANAVIGRIDNLKKTERREFVKRLAKEDIFKMLLNDSLKRKLKNIYLRFKYGVF